MEVFVALENLARFRALLATEGDGERRKTLALLIEEEEAKLARTLRERPSPAVDADGRGDPDQA